MWPATPLKDIAVIQGGIQKQPKRAPKDNAYPFLRVANVTAHGLDLDEVHEVELFEGELDRYRLLAGDLLVVEGNGSASQIGRACSWDGAIDNAVHQNHLIRIRPTRGLDARFLELAWNSPAIRDELSRIASSTSGLHTLSVSKLKRVHIPLPSLAEQRRIVEILEGHLSRLDAAATTLSVASQRTDALAQSVIDHATTQEIPEYPLKALLSQPLVNGRSVPTEDGGFPVLRLTALRDAGIDLAQRKGGAWTRAQAENFLVSAGDFFVARGNGSLRLVGRGSLVREVPDEVAFPDTMIRVRTDPDRLDAEYLSFVWSSRRVRSQLEGMARTTAGIYKVNHTHVGDVRFALPERAEQLSVVERVRRYTDSNDRLRHQLERTRERSAALRRAVLAAAFSGRLTGHRTDDEVMEELVAQA